MVFQKKKLRFPYKTLLGEKEKGHQAEGESEEGLPIFR